MFIQELFGGDLKKYKRECWMLAWRGSHALPVLEAILPHLILKKAQAELAIEWIGLLTKPSGPSLTHAEMQRRYRARLRGEEVPTRSGWRTTPESKVRRLEIVKELHQLKRQVA